MGDLALLMLEERPPTPDEVWSVVERIPNGPSTHWDTFVRVTGAVHALLNQRHPEDARGIAEAWASRSPKFRQKDFDAKWKSFQRDPIRGVGMGTLRHLADNAGEDAGGDVDRAGWDALRQACAALAGPLRAKARARMIEDAAADGWPLSSALSGKMLNPSRSAAVYAQGWSLDRIIAQYLDDGGLAVSDIALVRSEGGASRLADAEEVMRFSAYHAAVAPMVLVSAEEARDALQPPDWSFVREQLESLGLLKAAVNS